MCRVPRKRKAESLLDFLVGGLGGEGQRCLGRRRERAGLGFRQVCSGGARRGSACLTCAMGVSPGPTWRGFLLLLLGLWTVSSMEIYTPGSLEVLNGTDVRLKCTFRSREPVGQRLVISWDFQSRDKSQTEFVFHYQDQAYPPQTGRFSGRVTWDGNAFKSDASIMLWNVGPGDNGTFFCHIKNPPDVDGVAGEIELSVVLKVSFSEIHVLALTIGGACALMIAVVVVVVVCRQRRKAGKDQAEETEMPEKEKLRRVPEEEREATLPGGEA
nr:PREDICTED: myelin protein zero-like protein 2 [Anolis carolinensis]|eukprot:XP_003229021.2 PREDICTED: myelin protein zero-like protein 2 [Anolis carolinensis]